MCRWRVPSLHWSGMPRPDQRWGFSGGVRLALTYIIWLSFQMTLSSHLYWSIKSFCCPKHEKHVKEQTWWLGVRNLPYESSRPFFCNLFGAEATFIVCLYHTIQHLWKISWWKRREVQRMKAFLSRSWKASVQLLSVGNNHFLIFTMYLGNGQPSVDSTESRLRGLPDEEHTFETHDRTLRILTLPFLGTFFQVFCQVGWVFPVLMHENEIELVRSHSESQSMHAIHSRRLIIFLNIFTYWTKSHSLCSRVLGTATQLTLDFVPVALIHVSSHLRLFYGVMSCQGVVRMCLCCPSHPCLCFWWTTFQSRGVYLSPLWNTRDPWKFHRVSISRTKVGHLCQQLCGLASFQVIFCQKAILAR